MENIFEDLIVENFPCMQKEADFQVQEAQGPQKGSTQRGPHQDTYLEWKKIKNREYSSTYGTFSRQITH